MTKYKIWPVRIVTCTILIRELTMALYAKSNCWFFSSVLQQHLELHHGAKFVDGALKHPGLGEKDRRRLDQRLRAVSAPF